MFEIIYFKLLYRQTQQLQHVPILKQKTTFSGLIATELNSNTKMGNTSNSQQYFATPPFHPHSEFPRQVQNHPQGLRVP